MTIAVTDACIFIDLILLELHAQFFELEFDMHTTIDVLAELNNDQRQLLEPFIADRKLTAHNLSAQQRQELQQNDYPKSLSYPDCSVLYLASQIGAMVLSSDKVMRNWAKRMSMEYHGILWVIEEMVATKQLSHTEGIGKLDQLMKTNPTMAGSKEVNKKVRELISIWG
jgi:predicted nucleic acid-binding protein